MPVDWVDVFGHSFQRLVEMLLSKRCPAVVIVGHGDPLMGLSVPVADGTHYTIGPMMETLCLLVDNLELNDGDASGDGTKHWIDEFAVGSHISKATALRIAQTCLAIRQEPGIAVQVFVRGCSIGGCDDPGGMPSDHIRRIQRLFGSTYVEAPTCSMFYASVRPGKVASVATHAHSRSILGRRYIYKSDDCGPMMLDIAWGPDKIDTYCAVESTADVQRWADTLLEQKHVSLHEHHSFAVGGVYPDDDKYYYLADETEDYLSFMNSVRS